MMQTIVFSAVLVALATAVHWNNRCNSIVNMANTDFLDQDLVAAGYTPCGTNGVLPKVCATFFRGNDANKGKPVVLKTSGLAQDMASMEAALCAGGFAGIAFYEGTTKVVDYCLGNCTSFATPFVTRFDDAEHEFVSGTAMARVYISCPQQVFVPTVQYKLSALIA